MCTISGASNTVNCLLNIVQGVPNLLTQVTNVVQQLALNTVTNALSLITSCVAKALLSLDLTGALACAGTIINQVLSVVTSLLSTIAAVLGQAVNLVLSLAGCAVTALATVLQIAGTAVSSAVTCASQVGVLNIVLPPVSVSNRFYLYSRSREFFWNFEILRQVSFHWVKINKLSNDLDITELHEN